MLRENKPTTVSLTARELQVLQLLAKGMTTVQVAAELCIAPETVRGYRKQLHQKFNVSRVAELIYRAGEMKVI